MACKICGGYCGQCGSPCGKEIDPLGYDEFGPAYPTGPSMPPKRPLRSRMLDLALVWAFIAAMLWLLGGGSAHGQEYYDPMEMPQYHHPAPDAPLHEQFYFRWTEKDHPNVSCCNLGDCYPTVARAGRETEWAYKRREDGAWIDVPDEKVEDRKEFRAPDGRAHVCAPDPAKWPGRTLTYCFHPPASM